MLNDDPHISDQELLLLADGELSAQHDSKVRSHLASCWGCRTRLNELEAVIADFVHLYRDGLNDQLPNVDGPAALLRARLQSAAEQSIDRRFALQAMAFCATLVALFGFVVLLTMKQWPRVEASSVPRTDLTPGATIGISTGEACRGDNPHASREVPAALQDAVFREYGIAHPRPRAYEVDYLITPELGGARDIRNLWPEPYFTPVWNARVKDALEDRLHEMVCSRQLDLATAQRDISADWIRAYKKYFHTERPLPLLRR